jgi:hypothetical protein
MKDTMYVRNCPYVEQIAKETIWDFTTEEILCTSHFWMGVGSKSTRHRLAGTYKVITPDSTPISIEFREDKTLVVHTDKDTCEGTWSMGLGSARRYFEYTKDTFTCSINFDCQLIKRRYRCVFERDGVMILIPMKELKLMQKLDSWPRYNKDNYDYRRCLFLVREQEGKNRPQTVKQFTSYVKEVYGNEVMDKNIASTMKENFERRGFIILLYILLIVLYPLLLVGSLLLLVPTIINSLFSGIFFVVIWITILIWCLSWIIRLEGKFKDRQISEEKSYAKRIREVHGTSDFPDTSNKWTFKESWQGR